MTKLLYLLGVTLTLGTVFAGFDNNAFSGEALRYQWGLLWSFEQAGGRFLDAFGITQAQVVALDKYLEGK